MVSLEIMSFSVLGIMMQKQELVFMTAFGNEFRFLIQ